MDAFVQLLDLSSGDVVADFATEAEAIAALSEVLSEYGAQSVEELALVSFRDGHPSLIAMEKHLVLYVADVLANACSNDVHQLPDSHFGNSASKNFAAYEPRVGRAPSGELWRRAFQLHRAITYSMTISGKHVKYERLLDGVWARPALEATATNQMVLDCVA